MRNAVVADTGPLYAVFDPDDQYHDEARRMMERLRRERRGVVVAVSTLLEGYTLVVQRLGVAAALTWLSDVEQSRQLVLPTEADLAIAISLVRRYSDQDLTLSDGLLATISERLDLPIWTYDHHFDVIRASVWR